MEENISKKINELLLAKGMSVNALAVKSGVPAVTLYRCLAKNAWQISYVERIAKALHTSPSAFFCDSPSDSKVAELEERIRVMREFIRSELSGREP